MAGNIEEEKGVAVLVGAAPGFGASLAHAFAQDGFKVAGLSRSEEYGARLTEDIAKAGGAYQHYICDATEPGRLANVIDDIAHNQGIPSVLIYNPMKLVVTPFLELAPEDFEASWRATTFGAMAAAQTVLPHMLKAGGGAIIFTGATAAVKGNPRFTAFASAKFALRGLAQSLAREFGPKGVHIVHTILDGIIWSPQSLERFGVLRDKCLDPDAIARSYVHLTHQEPSAWTHEIDMRPFDEKF